MTRHIDQAELGKLMAKEPAGLGSQPSLELPREANALVDWWLPRVKGVLGDKLLSVMLFGSAAMGDYVSTVSDLDICSVLADPIAAEEAAAIGRVHDEMRELFIHGQHSTLGLVQVIEGPYVPLAVALDESAVAPCYTAGGRTRRFETGHPVSAFDRYSLAHVGHCLWGQRVQFAPPSHAALMKMLAADLAVLNDPSSWHDSVGWYVAMLCFIARSVFFWGDGVMLSKTEALRRCLAQGGEWEPAFEMALDARTRGKRAEALIVPLRAAFAQIAPTAHERLGSFAGL